jgi:tetratricopeptide (TPR) repeat protein
MSSVRHRSTAELPPNPLEFAYPLAVPDPTVLGAVILHEVPDAFALHVLQALRLVFAWAAGPGASGAVFDGTDLEAWEADVLRTRGIDEALWAPVGAIAAELVRPADVDQPRLAHACLAVTDWALGADAHGTAVLFGEAAAVVWPSNARIAWITGKLYRERLQLGQAEMWLKRASRVAVWTGDWELQAQAINSLGNLKLYKGDLGAARELLQSAVRISKRKRLRERQATALHDLFVVSTYAGKFDEAESYAQQAFAAYGPDHPNLLSLTFDVAHLCTQQGQFGRAFQVLNELRGRFSDDEGELRVIASIARAAGAAGNPEVFQTAWAQAWKLIDTGAVEHIRAAAALELGLGAISLGWREHAEAALLVARNTATDSLERELLSKAESALEKLDYHQAAAIAQRLRPAGRTRAGELAAEYVQSLDSNSGSLPDQN